MRGLLRCALVVSTIGLAAGLVGRSAGAVGDSPLKSRSTNVVAVASEILPPTTFHDAPMLASLFQRFTVAVDHVSYAVNGGAQGIISAEQSRVTVRVIPTDEEIVIARTVRRLIV